MQILKNVPSQLRGRGATACIAIKCDCGETFLWGNIRTPDVQCPTCKATEILTDDAPVQNGQMK